MAEYPLFSEATMGISAKRLQAPWGAWGLRIAAITYLCVFVAVPVLVVNVEGFRAGADAFVKSLTSQAAINAIWLTLWTSAVMTLVNVVMGTLTAYVLVTYRFPGKAALNSLVDLPFAIPTLVTGVMLVLLYGPQTAIGGFFRNGLGELGFRIIFAPPGIVLALLFVGYPFVIRAVQPVLLTMESNQQEAAQTLGASGWYTFRRVIFPAIRPAVITGGLLSFARALGEFGAIIVVAGTTPQTATVYVYGQVEAGDMQSASAVSVVLLFIAFAITLTVDIVESRRHA